MKNFKISITFDSLFIFVSAFFLFYAIIRYNGVNFLLSLTLSVLISLALGGAWTVFSLIKKDKQGVKLTEENNLLRLKQELCFMDNKTLSSLLLKYYKKAKGGVSDNDYRFPHPRIPRQDCCRGNGKAELCLRRSYTTCR